MVDAITDKIIGLHLLASVFAAVSIGGVILTIGFWFFDDDGYTRRMKELSRDRGRGMLRQRSTGRGAQSGGGLRQEPNAYMKDLVERYSLSTWLNTEDAKTKLASAGYRGPQAEVAFLFFRAVSPIGFVIVVLLYFYIFESQDIEFVIVLGASVAALLLGVKAPEIFLSNMIAKRQKSMKRAFPDALDLMLICVESGMSIEAAFRRVGQEIGVQSVDLAGELALATAELSLLPDRRAAYNNLALRTGLEGVRQLVTVLIQAERYGTSLGQALRVAAQESRDNRMMEAEKLAASLPPKLTVPMIVFFLPVLMVVVMAPALIQIPLGN